MRSVRDEVREVKVGGVGLHYVERGAGEPLVLIHGGLGDWSYWQDQIEAFARRWHVVAYSRRYAWPNDNATFDPDYSPRTDARDLAGLLEQLGLSPAHLVAASIGGCAALFLAAERPDMVRSLTLAEPPMLRWIRNTVEGEAEWARWLGEVWHPAAAAFRAGRARRGVELFIDGFLGRGGYEALPERVQARILRNARELAAQTLSRDPFPELALDRLPFVTAPTLLFSGGRTRRQHQLVDAELERLLPDVRRILFPEASHDIWVDEPVACRDATVEFLSDLT